MISSKYVSQWRRRKSRKGEEKNGKRGKRGEKDKKGRDEVGKRGKKKKENYGFRLILWFSRHENVVPKVSRMWDYKQIQGSLMYSRF